MEEIRKEQIVEGKIKEYAIKDKTAEEIVEVKRNYLSIQVIYYL